VIDYTEDDFLALNDEILKREVYLRFRIKGESMSPSLRDKDVVIIKRFNLSEIKTGDIIFYRIPPSQIVIHRLIKRTLEDGKMAFITKGDANFYFDPYVYPKDILGKIVAIERDRRYIRLDTFMSKLKAIFYVKSFLMKRWFWRLTRVLRHKILGVALRKLQGIRIYSYLAKRFARGKITYRIATNKDAPLLAQLFRRYHQSTRVDIITRFFRKYLEELADSGCCILAEYRNKVVGSVTIKKFPEDGTIYSGWRAYNRYVRLPYRRIGIGEGLARIAIKKAIENGAVSVKGITSKDDIRTINLAKKLGFHQIKGGSPQQVIFELNKSDITYEL